MALCQDAERQEEQANDPSPADTAAAAPTTDHASEAPPLAQELVCERTDGRLHVNTKLFAEELTKFATKRMNTHDFKRALDKLERLSKTKMVFGDQKQQAVYSVPRSFLVDWVKNINLKRASGLHSRSDRLEGRYEGGFKVWESTSDLLAFVTSGGELMDALLCDRRKLRVLELGAGTALPSLALALRLRDDPEKKLRLHVQDLNSHVLVSVTLLNFALNLGLETCSQMIDDRSLVFHFGDWSVFHNKHKFHLIMMSEVLYSCESYEALHSLLDRQLNLTGTVLIATKDTYFGLSGSCDTWLEFVRSRPVFQVLEVIQTLARPIPRSIIVMKRLVTAESKD